MYEYVIKISLIHRYVQLLVESYCYTDENFDNWYWHFIQNNIIRLVEVIHLWIICYSNMLLSGSRCISKVWTNSVWKIGSVVCWLQVCSLLLLTSFPELMSFCINTRLQTFFGERDLKLFKWVMFFPWGDN